MTAANAGQTLHVHVVLGAIDNSVSLGIDVNILRV